MGKLHEYKNRLKIWWGNTWMDYPIVIAWTAVVVVCAIGNGLLFKFVDNQKQKMLIDNTVLGNKQVLCHLGCCLVRIANHPSNPDDVNGSESKSSSQHRLTPDPSPNIYYLDTKIFPLPYKYSQGKYVIQTEYIQDPNKGMSWLYAHIYGEDPNAYKD